MPIKINQGVLMKKITIILSVFVLNQLSLAKAEVVPQSLLSDQRIMVVPYHDNQVVPIRASAFINTQVSFGQTENIIDVQSGDDGAWTYHVYDYVPNIINIKPSLPKSDTNLEVITEDDNLHKRFYHFHLLMDDQLVSKVKTYVIKFTYPQDVALRKQLRSTAKELQDQSLKNVAKQPQKYYWGYTFNGDKRIVPSHVFDDGKFIYLQIRDQQKIPAVFAVDNAQGNESVVNTRKEGDYLIVQGLYPQLTLRNGSVIVASIFNRQLIKQINNQQ
jgi:type IV secretion system protein VirB9